MTLLLPTPLRERIACDASSRYPIEACGILIGDRDSSRRTVREVRVESNTHGGSRRRRFAIAPEALLRAQKEARAAGLEVVGYYHSHPDASAVPSARDLEAAWPEVSYLIVAVEEAGAVELRSWRLDSDSRDFEEERIEYSPA